VSGQLHSPSALPPGKSPLYALYRRLGGPQSRSGRLEKWKSLTLPGLEIRPLRRSVHSQSLYRLQYPGCRTINSGNIYYSDLKLSVIQHIFQNVKDLDTRNCICLFHCMVVKYSSSIWGNNRTDKFKKHLGNYIYLTRVKKMGYLRYYITKNWRFYKGRIVLSKIRSRLVSWSRVVDRNAYRLCWEDNIIMKKVKLSL
jgi:hypothetical protein